MITDDENTIVNGVCGYKTTSTQEISDRLFFKWMKRRNEPSILIPWLLRLGLGSVSYIAYKVNLISEKP